MSNIKTWQERAGTFRESYLGQSAFQIHGMFVREELDDLRAALAKAEQENQILTAERDSLQSACDARDAHISALAAQEPVGVVGLVSDVDTEDGIPYAVVDLRKMVDSGDKLYAAAGAAAVPMQTEIVDALECLMEWQVKNVKVWHNPAYDNADRVLKKLATAPKEPT